MTNSNNFINKKRLFWYLIKRNLILIILCTILIIFIFAWEINYTGATAFSDRILFLLVCSVVYIILLYSTFNRTRRIFKSIRNQEKILGFSFNDEMEKQGLQKLPIQTNQWFINRHMAYHRNFIVEAKHLYDVGRYGDKNRNRKKNKSNIIIIGKDKTKSWLQADVSELLEWIKRINEEAVPDLGTTKIRLDRLYEKPQPRGSILWAFSIGVLTVGLMLLLIDNASTLISRQSLLQDVTRTTATVVRADRSTSDTLSPNHNIRVSFEANGRQHIDRIRVPITSVAVGDEIEIYFANENNCVIMAVENDIATRHYTYNIVMAAIFTLFFGLIFLVIIYSSIMSGKIKKYGDDWWSDRVQNSKKSFNIL